MTIQTGEHLPEGKLTECTEFDPANGCPLNPQPVDVATLTKGKKIVIFGVPGAFTPTCSVKHLPGYVKNADKFKVKGVDTVACVAVNDVFVLEAWRKSEGVGDTVKMLADGSGDFAKAAGLTFDLSGRGLGVRVQRFSAIVDDGVVKSLNVEEPGAFEVSGAERLLDQL
jgi:peroxiredoxin